MVKKENSAEKSQRANFLLKKREHKSILMSHYMLGRAIGVVESKYNNAENLVNTYFEMGLNTFYPVRGVRLDVIPDGTVEISAYTDKYYGEFLLEEGKVYCKHCKREMFKSKDGKDIVYLCRRCSF